MVDDASVNVLFVDLDGTLVATDVLWEALRLASKRDPLVLMKFPRWAARGRAAAKRALAQRVTPDPMMLPYREEVLAFLWEEKARGRTLVLATATDGLWAQAIARHVGCFDDVLASNGQRNLKGVEKLKAIKTYCQAQGVGTFAYMGDAMADLPIWEQAAQVYVVAPTARLVTALRPLRQPSRIFGGRRSRMSSVLQAFGFQLGVKRRL